MANFDSGIQSYIHAQATVDVFFPVDYRGNADVSCKHCPFFRTQSRRCSLNGAVCQYPERYVGATCPLTEVKESEAEAKNE